METGVLSSLDPCSKHNIIHGSQPHKIRDYESANTDNLRADLPKLNWHDLSWTGRFGTK